MAGLFPSAADRPPASVAAAASVSVSAAATHGSAEDEEEEEQELRRTGGQRYTPPAPSGGFTPDWAQPERLVRAPGFRKQAAAADEASRSAMETELLALRERFRVRNSQAALAVVNLVLVAMGISLLVYGTSRDSEFSDWWMKSAAGRNGTAPATVDIRPTPGINAIANPFDDLVWVGALLLLFSLAGFVGSVFYKRRIGKEALFVYFGSQLLVTVLLTWSGIMCLRFQDRAQDALEHVLAREWAIIEDIGLPISQIQMHNAVENRSSMVLAAGLSFTSAFLTSLACLATLKLGGAAFTLRRTLLTTSVTGAVGGSVLGFMALVALAKGDAVGGEWRAAFVGVSSVAAVLLSFLAIMAIRKESIVAMGFHCSAMLLLSAFTAFAAILAMFFPTPSEAFLDSHWDVVQDTITFYSEERAKMVVEENLYRVGAGCMVMGVLVVLNCVASLCVTMEMYAARKQRAVVVLPADRIASKATV